MNQNQWKQVVGIFLVSIIINAYTLRDIRDPILLIHYAFEKQMMGFINSIFAAAGYSLGIAGYNYFKNKKK